MENLIDKVARAIVQADEQNGGPPWDYVLFNKHVAAARRDRAEAVLKALGIGTTHTLMSLKSAKKMKEALEWYGEIAEALASSKSKKP